MAKNKYTTNQAIEIANLAVELGQEIEHIARFGYASKNARSFALRIGPYMDVFKPVIREIPIEERSKLPIRMRDFSKLVKTTQEEKESSGIVTSIAGLRSP